mgnify:CR=1 FL=1
MLRLGFTCCVNGWRGPRVARPNQHCHDMKVVQLVLLSYCGSGMTC